MTIFDTRGEAFQRQFVREEELRFMARARRTKLFGLMIAERLGLAATEAADYATALVVADISTADDQALIGRVIADLDRAGVAGDPAELRARLAAFMVHAMEDVRR
jgi:hypothetical protein